MKLEQAAYSVESVISFKDNIHEYLRQTNLDEKAEEKLLGGILSDIRYSWLAKGPRLEIIHNKFGRKIAAWCFGAVLHDFKTCITCVVDLPAVRSGVPLLVVGLECEITGGMVCVFDIASSRVVRAIQIDDKVTSITVVSTGYENSLPGALRALDGVIAVGTARGKVFLIDLCRQICEEAIANTGSEIVRDEINSCQLIHIDFENLKNLERLKEMSLSTGDHLSIQINENQTSGSNFALFGPKGDLILRANISEVVISSLYYNPQLCSLFIGYNFGAFQIYNILEFDLQYTSPLYDEFIPVANFTVQEPCDDPRAFCYLWIVYSFDYFEDNFTPIAVMYALSYNSKDFLENYGNFYQSLTSVSIQFQFELKDVTSKIDFQKSARCLTLRSFSKLGPNIDDKLAICTLVVCLWNGLNTETYLVIFDLNQWYKEQMPSVLSKNCEKFVTCVCVTDLLELRTKNEAEILDYHIDASTITPFVCPQRLEEHYHPSALSHRGTCLRSTGLIFIKCAGMQRHILSQLERLGPLCLLRPSDLYNQCISLGLFPNYSENLTSNNAQIQRSVILSVALEHRLTRWLNCCARDWANGSQSSEGCTINFFLDWAWNRAKILKVQADKICIPLFDYSGSYLDTNSFAQLNHCACQIKNLAMVFENVVKGALDFFTEEDAEDIRYQCSTLQTISVYFEVLQWLLNVGLLPEAPLSMYPRSENDRINAPYPFENLSNFYSDRRAELSKLLKTEPSDILFIDNLINFECRGDLLSEQWRSDGGTGAYPPPSLQALLRSYLLENVEIVHKHCLFIYVFLDLAMTLDQNRYKSIITHLIKFPAVFKISPSIIKITQAFWQLDHGDFSTAMAQLLDPSITNEALKPWHHRTVLRALLLQGQNQHALLYQKVRKPQVSNVKDLCIVITLLIVNDLLEECFHFQRKYRNVHNEKEVLQHFFATADNMKQMSSILQLPLSLIEETEFIQYLKKNSTEFNKVILISYFLQRDRYAEAFEINDVFNDKEIFKQGLLGQQDRNFRNVIVNGFKKTLPDVTQTLLDFCKKQKDFAKIPNKTVDRPLPMSVFIHDVQNQATYKSTLIQASFQKAKETWSTVFPNKINLDDTPFISTPKISAQDERNEISMIFSTIMPPNFPDSEPEATPPKRLRLSSRQSINDLRRPSNDLSNSLLDTPIVKRRSYRSISKPNDSIGTPQSILKMRSFLREKISLGLRERSKTPEELENMEDDDLESEIMPVEAGINDSMASPKRHRSPLGVLPRRPIQRTPRPAVHFEERPNSRSSSTGSLEQPQQNIEVQIEVHNEPLNSKNSSTSIEETFYSPNTSFSEPENWNIEKIRPCTTLKDESSAEITSKRSSLKRKLSDNVIQPRRSYKSTPNTTTEVFPKLGARRSLSRKVLEQNTLSKILPNMQTRLSVPNISPEKQTVSVEISYSKNITSFTQKSSDNLLVETCDKSTTEMKNKFSLHKDSNLSSKIFEHVHNESSSKTRMKIVTKVEDEERFENVEEESVGKVLSFSSNTGDSICDVSQNYSETHDITSASIASKDEKPFEDVEENEEVSMEEVEENPLIEKPNLSETVFEEISSIIEESSEEEEEIEEQELEEQSKDEELKNVEETSSMEEDKLLNEEEESDDSSVKINEIFEPQPERRYSSSDEENQEECEEEEYEEENILVQSSDEDSDNEKMSYEEAEDEEKSSRSSEVIEIGSSSEDEQNEESNEEIKIGSEIAADIKNFGNKQDSEQDTREINEEIEENSREFEMNNAVILELNEEMSNSEHGTESSKMFIEEIAFEETEYDELNLGIVEEYSEVEENINEENVIQVNVLETNVTEDKAMEETENKSDGNKEEDTEIEITEIEENSNLSDRSKEIKIVETQTTEFEDKSNKTGTREDNKIEDTTEEPQEIQDRSLNTEISKENSKTTKILDTTDKTNVLDEKLVHKTMEETGKKSHENEENTEIEIAGIEENSNSSDRSKEIKIDETQTTKFEDKSNKTGSKEDNKIEDTTEEPQEIQVRSLNTEISKENSKTTKILDTTDETNVLDEKFVHKTMEETAKKSNENEDTEIEITEIEESSNSSDRSKEIKIDETQTTKIEDKSNRTDTKEDNKIEDTTEEPQEIQVQSSNTEISKENSKTTKILDTTDKTNVSDEKFEHNLTISPSQDCLEAIIISESSETREPETILEKFTPSRRITRSSSKVEETESKKPVLRKRSTSMDTNQISRSTRQRSNSEEKELRKRSTRASSVALPVIKEEIPIKRSRKRSGSVADEQEVEKNKRLTLENVAGTIEEYSSTHRLTRRQKMIMEKSLELQETKKRENASLRKDLTPPSEPRTPERSPNRPPRRKSFTLAQQAISTPTRSRRSSRAGSQDPSDVATDVSDALSVCSVPVVVLTDIKRSNSRHRSLSPSAFIEDSTFSSPRSKRRSSRTGVLPIQTDLTKISEEPTESNESLVSIPKESRPKRGRPKKINPDESQSESPDSQTSSKRNQRLTTYKSLEEYLPKYTAVKTRKYFKLKRSKK